MTFQCLWTSSLCGLELQAVFVTCLFFNSLSFSPFSLPVLNYRLLFFVFFSDDLFARTSFLWFGFLFWFLFRGIWGVYKSGTWIFVTIINISGRKIFFSFLFYIVYSSHQRWSPLILVIHYHYRYLSLLTIIICTRVSRCVVKRVIKVLKLC